jgi:multimeric flavodoxin WrbA
MPTSLRALIFNCTLKPSGEASSTQLLAEQLAKEMEDLRVTAEFVRAVDYDIRPGVETDMGNGDEWPALRQKMLESDIVVVATPTWVGQMSSVALRIVERLDAELSEKDEEGRLLTFGKVAAVAVVGNEDGAHKISADLFQALNDVGFSVPAQAVTYWNGEAMGRVDYKDLKQTPGVVASTNKLVATNVVHMARILKESPYPAIKEDS